MKKYEEIKKASILGIVGNLFLTLIKGIIGFITNSQAMIADFFNSAGDIISSVMTFIGNKIASIPKDEDHNLGHGKAEYIYSMLVSIILFLTSIIILKDSFKVVIFHIKYEYSNYLIIVCIITIIIKILLYFYTNKLAKKYNNILIKANSKDHLNDAIISILNLISAFLALNNIYIIDGIVGIIIGLWILYTSIKIFKESYDVLMDKSISNELKNKVYEVINKHKEVIKVIHFNSTPVGYQYQISFTIYVDGNLSTFDSHQIADTLEKEIDNEFDEIYLTIIHVNPMKIEK